MANIISTPSKRKRNISTVALVAVVAILIVGAIAVAVLMARNTLQVTFGEQDSTSSQQHDVCGKDMIGRYNTVMGSTKMDANKLTSLTKEITGNASYVDDADCLFIIAQGSAFAGQTTQAKDAYDRLKTQSESGDGYASGSINTLTSLRELSVIVGDVKATNNAGSL